MGLIVTGCGGHSAHRRAHRHTNTLRRTQCGSCCGGAVQEPWEPRGAGECTRAGERRTADAPVVSRGVALQPRRAVNSPSTAAESPPIERHSKTNTVIRVRRRSAGDGRDSGSSSGAGRALDRPTASGDRVGVRWTAPCRLYGGPAAPGARLDGGDGGGGAPQPASRLAAAPRAATTCQEGEPAPAAAPPVSPPRRGALYRTGRRTCFLRNEAGSVSAVHSAAAADRRHSIAHPILRERRPVLRQSRSVSGRSPPSGARRASSPELRSPQAACLHPAHLYHSRHSAAC